MGNKAALERIREIRQLSEKHHFTLVMSEFAQVGQYVQMENWVFRAVKAAVPGRYTFILRATRDVPKVMLHPKKHTVGVRVPELPMTDGWQVKEALDGRVDAVLDSGDCGLDPTTVVDFSSGTAVITREGAGDPEPFR